MGYDCALYDENVLIDNFCPASLVKTVWWRTSELNWKLSQIPLLVNQVASLF
jgi:hypothetical protein